MVDKINIKKLKDEFANWKPLKLLTRGNENYKYTGDIPNTPAVKNNQTKFVNDQGRKVTYVVDKGDKHTLCVYVSKTFYPEMCRTQYPAYGRRSL